MKNKTWRAYLSLTLCVFIQIASNANDQWNIRLYPISKPTTLYIKSSKPAQIEFAGYNNDNRNMYDANLTIYLPDSTGYLTQSITPSTDVEFFPNRIRWSNIEQHIQTLSKGDPLPSPQGWWVTLKVFPRRQGVGKIEASLEWKNQEGNSFTRKFVVRNVTVPAGVVPTNQPPSIKQIIGPSKTPDSEDIYAFEANASDPEGNNIQYRWQIDKKSWSNWSQKPNYTQTLAFGKHTVQIEVKDDQDNFTQLEKNFPIDKSPSPSWLPILVIVLIGAATAGYIYLTPS